MTASSIPHLAQKTLSDRAALALAAAEHIAGVVRHAIDTRGHAVLGLSGGSTPGPTYRLLRQQPHIDWSVVTCFLVDERFVPADHPDSNLHLIRTTLLQGPAAAATVIMPDTSLPAEECARQYDETLASLATKQPIDLLVMGLGPDGHIASLFPPLPPSAFGPSSVLLTETDRFVVRKRVGATLLFLLKARQSLFLLAGDEKRRTWESMLNDASGSVQWPAKALLQHYPTLALFCP